MIPVTEQLEFARNLHAGMMRADCKRVAEGAMTEADAERRAEAMTGIIATLEKHVLLGEVSDHMAATWREIAKEMAV